MKVGEGVDGAEEGHVALPELEEGAGDDGAGQEAVADERPGLDTALLTIILKQLRVCFLIY